MSIFFGFFLLFFPFTYIFLFENKIKSFLYVITSIFGLNISLALTSQYFGFFNYKTIVLIYSLILCITTIFLLYKKKKFNIQSSISIPFIFAIVLIFIQLWSIHYHYTGPVHTTLGAYVTNSSYSYPLFSDEWNVAAFAKYSIETGNLPAINPFDQNKPFANFLLAFSSLVGQFFLITQLNPVTNFAILAILVGVFICIVCYVFLRTLSIHPIISAITILCIPLIAQGGNLPGIWFVLGYIISFILFIVFLCGLIYKDKFLYITGSILSFMLYFPMLLFIFPAYVFYFLKNKKIILALIPIGILPFIIYPELISKIIRPNLDGGIISFPILSIIPLFVIPFVCIGIFKLYTQKQYIILAPIAIGLVYWTYYASFFSPVVIIEYPRIVIITSLLLVLCTGLGLNTLKAWIVKPAYIISIAGCFILITIYYPIGENWRHFTTLPENNNSENIFLIIPTPPIKHHLTQEDVELFKNIHNTRFITQPWKGLAIGTYTSNDPLESKASIVRSNILSYTKFMNMDCEEKTNTLIQYRVSYVYSAKIDCKNFKYIGENTEGLKLYRVVKDN